MELSSPKIKKFLILSGSSPQNIFFKNFLYFFLKTPTLKKFVMFQEIELSSLKPKNLLIFWGMELSYIFSKRTFFIFR